VKGNPPWEMGHTFPLLNTNGWNLGTLSFDLNLGRQRY